MNRQVRTVKLRTCGVRARIVVTDTFNDLMQSLAPYGDARIYKNHCMHTFCENYLEEIIPMLVHRSPAYRNAVFEELFQAVTILNPALKEYFEARESVDDDCPAGVTLVPVNVSIANIPKKKLLRRQKETKPVELRITKESVQGLAEYLNARVFGQEEAINSIYRSFEVSLVGLGDPERPRGSYIFIGDTGTGKTMTVKEIARYFYKDEWRKALWTINGSEFMEDHECAKLLGSPAGYVGYDDGSAFLEHVKANPETIILVDEFEKAHPKLQDIFLQVLDDGGIVDNKGARVDFSKCFVVFTSNIGTQEVYRKNDLGFVAKTRDHKACTTSVNTALTRFCRPEFLKRFDGTIVFKQLGDSEMLAIAKAELDIVKKRLKDKSIKLNYNNTVLKWLVGQIDEESTARDMNAIVKKFVTLPISTELMKEEDFDVFKITVEENQLQVRGERIHDT